MRVALIVCALLVNVAPGFSQLCEREVFLAPAIGEAVALDRRLLIVGSSRTNSATAYELMPGGWQRDAEFTGALPGEFGTSVDIDVATMAIGAPSETGQRGAVYTYQHIAGSWVPTQRLVTSDANPNRFGASLSLSDNTLVMGAPLDGDVGELGGAVYVFQRASASAPWLEVQKLTAPDGTSFDTFGFDVAVARNVILVGAPQADADGVNGGAIYVFENSPSQPTFELTARVIDVVPGASDLFGASVTLDLRNPVIGTDDVSLVGAPLDDEISPDAGMVSAVRRVGDTWRITQRFGLGDADVLDRFGTAVSLDGGQGVVSAPSKQGGLGLTIVVEDIEGDFHETMRVGASLGVQTLGFGASADISDGTVVVGAARPFIPGGGVYVYAGLNPWVDFGASLAGTNGAPSLTLEGPLCPDTPLDLRARDALPSALAALVLGFFPISTPFAGGTLVPNPDAIFGVATDPAGNLDISSPWPSDIPQGIDLFLQLWVVDPGGPAGYSATNVMVALTP